jgi:cell fate regulator YaaT (PSP1 superfamily)
MKSRVEEIEAYKLQQEINELYNNLQNKIESEKRDMKFIDDVIEKYKQGELTKMV